MKYDEATNPMSLMLIKPGHALWPEVTDQVYRRYKQAFNANRKQH